MSIGEGGKAGGEAESGILKRYPHKEISLFTLFSTQKLNNS